MAHDDKEKARAKFKQGFRKITAAEVKDLTDKQKKVYDKIATKVFVFSIFYLFFIFSTILIDNYLGL